MVIFSTAAETAVAYLSCCCKHGGSFLFCKCVSFHPPWTIPCWQHLASPPTWLLARPWKMQHLMLLVVNWCTMCRSTLYVLCWATLQITCPRLPSFSRQHWTSCLLCGGLLTCGLCLLPTLRRRGIFSFPRVPSSLCMGVAARSLQQYWIPAPWVKAGRLPAEEMLWKWDLLLLCRGTGYFRTRLCWRYGLGQDYHNC